MNFGIIDRIFRRLKKCYIYSRIFFSFIFNYIESKMQVFLMFLNSLLVLFLKISSSNPGFFYCLSFPDFSVLFSFFSALWLVAIFYL